MKSKDECMLCETKFKVDSSFKQLFCMSCEHYKDNKL